MRTLNNTKLFIAALAAVLLTACGGGGGGSSSGSLPPLLITSSNYVDVAENSVARANGVSGTSSLGTSLVGAQISQAESIALKDIALSTAATLLDNWAMFDNPTIVGAVTSNTVNCPGGGTVSGVVNASNNLTPSTGDTVSATFNNCNLNGVLGNGSLYIVINSYSGSNLSTNGSASLTMVFSNFTAGSDAVDGSITMGVTVSSATVRTVTLAMPNFLVTANGDSFYFSAFSMTAAQSGSSASLSMAGSISSARYGGSVIVSTPSAFAINSSRSVSGQILMTGKNGTKARVTGQGTTILIEADTTGSGTYDVHTSVAVNSLVSNW